MAKIQNTGKLLYFGIKISSDLIKFWTRWKVFLYVSWGLEVSYFDPKAMVEIASGNLR